MQPKRSRAPSCPALLSAFAAGILGFVQTSAAGNHQTLWSSPRPPKIRFADVTASAGIGFVHVNGATGDKLLPETMGGGCAFFDFDGDNDQDILLVNSTYWSNQPSPPALRATSHLYENDGKGVFRDVTAGSGLELSFYGMGVATGDYDNDGLADVFISGVGANHLFHNEGHGKFRDVSGEAGISPNPDLWSTSCAWIDYNNDGRLDLFVCNYVRWSRELDLKVNDPPPGKPRLYGPPLRFEGSYPLLYRNEGGGRFEEVSASAKLRVKEMRSGKPACKALGVAPIDLDEDGWIDLIVANDTVPNLVFHNQRDGTFREIGHLSGLAYDAFGNVRGAMGIDTAWFRDDASLGVAIANYENEMNGFYVAQPRTLHFTDEAPVEALGPASRPLLKFGLFFFDYDLDGWPDLLTANGHLDAQLGISGPQAGYAQPAQLFWNGGPRQSAIFTPVGPDCGGSDLFEPIVGRGAAFADIDGDGDLDVLLTQIAGRPKLLRNEQATRHRWIRVRLIGSRSNRDAIGARVTIRGAERIWQAQVMPARSYLSQCELPITLGFGNEPLPPEMQIRWPSGLIQTVKLPRESGALTVREPEK
ncbi:MAG: CRTAC1 family protein [Verrucomicrobiota bacterium]